jgi:transposase
LFGGQIFVFRGRRGGLIKVLWRDGQRLCLFAKRLEKGYFVWPSAADGVVALSAAQLGMLPGGIDWRMPVLTWRADIAQPDCSSPNDRPRHSSTSRTAGMML